MFSQKRQVYICEDCSAEFKPDLKNVKRKVFISYGHDEHGNLALSLANDLITKGYQVWIDKEGIKTGSDWEVHIEIGLDWVSDNPGENRFCLLMTPHSVRRPDGFCLNELAMAIGRRVRVVPIMVSMCEPPLSICRIQWLDMMDCVPVSEKNDRYKVKLELLVNTLEQKNVDYMGEQSRLLSLLEPISFDADIALHVSTFTGRKKVLDSIDAWTKSDDGGRVFFITGPPGVGKTAISSWLCNNRSDVAAFHLCRFGNVERSDARKCVLSIAYQLSTQLPEYRERLSKISINMDIREMDVSDLFNRIVVQPLSGDFPAPGQKKIVIVDAVDEAVHGGKNGIIELFAGEFMKTPDWLRLIITSRPDPQILYSLQGIVPYAIEPDAPENYSDLKEYLEIELKKLNDDKPAPQDVVDTILLRSEGIFLYIKCVMSELQAGKLSLDRIDEFPRGLGGVYAQFFRRQFPDAEYYKSKIRPALELIVASREPISLGFVIDSLKWDAYEQADITGNVLTLFPVDDGKIWPFHKTLTEWITDIARAGPYFVSVERGNKILAEYGMKAYEKGEKAWTKYLITYLIEHLHASKREEDIGRVLNDLKFIRRAWELDRYNLIKQWVYIEEHTGLHMPEVYASVVEAPDHYDVKDVELVSDLMHITSHRKESFTLLEYLIGYYARSEDMAGLQKVIGDQAYNYISSSEYDKAMMLLKRREKICRDINRKDGVASSLKYQADIRFWQGDVESASKLWEEESAICQETGNRERLAVSLNNSAFFQRYKGNLEASMAILKEQEKICREIGDKPSLQECIGDQGFIMYLTGDFKKALRLFKEQEKICRELRNIKFFTASLFNQMDTYIKLGQLKKSEELLTEIEGHTNDIDRSLKLEISGVKGNLLMHKGELERAMDVFKEQEKDAEELGYKAILQKSFGGQGSVYRQRGDLDKALHLYVEQEKVCRDVQYVYGLQEAHGNLALIYMLKGDLAAALKHNYEQEDICRKRGYKYWLQVSLGRKSEILKRMGDEEGASRSLSEQEKLCSDIHVKKSMIA